MLAPGKAERLKDGDYERLAYRLGVHPRVLVTIALVESGRTAWYPGGRPKILFEKHKFYQYLPKSKKQKALNLGLARRTWSRSQYGDQGGNQATQEVRRYKLLARAIKYDRKAAFMAISTGLFQMMGFNYSMTKHKSAEAMYHAFADSEREQLEALGDFLKTRKLISAMNRKDWEKIALRYNGSGQIAKYSAMFRKQYARLAGRKWLTKKQVEEIDKGKIVSPVKKKPIKKSSPKPKIETKPIEKEKIDKKVKTEDNKPKQKKTLFSVLGNLLAAFFGDKKK